MLTTVLTTSAIFASAVYAQGIATVINKCKYDVHVCNVPAAGGGFDQIDKVLSPDGEYSQQWTPLSNSQGWSIKLGKDDLMANIMQYEYTYHSDGIIWYDLSEVNGNPWNGNWMITASGGDCNPKQQAYRYSTDDAYGMQACPDSTDITVTLCSGESQDDGGAASASESAAAKTSDSAAASSPYEAPSSPAPAPTTYAQATTSAAPTSAAPTWGNSQPWGVHDNAVAIPVSSPTPTTLATSPAVVDNGYGVTVTQVETAVVTNIVTATAYAAKRHEHHARHPHHRHV